MSAENPPERRAITRAGEIAGRRADITGNSRADMRALAESALEILAEFETIARAFPEIQFRIAAFNVARAQIAWVRDSLDGHG